MNIGLSVYIYIIEVSVDVCVSWKAQGSSEGAGDGVVNIPEELEIHFTIWACLTASNHEIHENPSCSRHLEST